MKKLIFGLCLLLSMFSCTGGQKQGNNQDMPMEIVDSLGVDAD